MFVERRRLRHCVLCDVCARQGRRRATVAEAATGKGEECATFFYSLGTLTSSGPPDSPVRPLQASYQPDAICVLISSWT